MKVTVSENVIIKILFKELNIMPKSSIIILADTTGVIS